MVKAVVDVYDVDDDVLMVNTGGEHMCQPLQKSRPWTVLKSTIFISIKQKNKRQLTLKKIESILLSTWWIKLEFIIDKYLCEMSHLLQISIQQHIQTTKEQLLHHLFKNVISKVIFLTNRNACVFYSSK